MPCLLTTSLKMILLGECRELLVTDTFMIRSCFRQDSLALSTPNDVTFGTWEFECLTEVFDSDNNIVVAPAKKKELFSIHKVSETFEAHTLGK